MTISFDQIVKANLRVDKMSDQNRPFGSFLPVFCLFFVITLPISLFVAHVFPPALPYAPIIFVLLMVLVFVLGKTGHF
jgi:predicted membrane metal-binding protein